MILTAVSDERENEREGETLLLFPPELLIKFTKKCGLKNRFLIITSLNHQLVPYDVLHGT